MLLFKHDNIAWTVALLAALWLLLFVPALQIRAVKSAPLGWHRKLDVLLAFFFVTVLVTLFGVYVWPESGLGILDEKEKELFTRTLKTESNPATIRLMCPPNDDLDCSRAAQFVRIFGLAGWPLASQSVERIVPGQPKMGVYLVLHSTADIDYSKPEFRNPNVGVWTEMPHGHEALKKAFDAIGVKLDSESGTSFPSGTIGIYFGPGTARGRSE